jgi:hypothetical protein
MDPFMHAGEAKGQKLKVLQSAHEPFYDLHKNLAVDNPVCQMMLHLCMYVRRYYYVHTLPWKRVNFIHIDATSFYAVLGFLWRKRKIVFFTRWHVATGANFRAILRLSKNRSTQHPAVDFSFRCSESFYREAFRETLFSAQKQSKLEIG